jgi:hypothetical protein
MNMENKRGGARKHAGRKKLGKTSIMVYLSPENAEFVREMAEKYYKTLSSTVEEFIVQARERARNEG